MEWKDWIGKRIFLRTKSGKVYSGRVLGVDDSDKTMVFFTIKDKFDQWVTIVHNEIIELKEEVGDGYRDLY